jgi:hypothetical protein
VTTANGLTNSGFLSIDVVHGGGSAFNVGGTLTNSGSVDLGNFSIFSPTTLTAAGLDNTGGILIQGNSGNPAGQANFIVNGAASNTVVVDIGPASNLTVTGAGNAYTQNGPFSSTVVDGTLSAASVDITRGFLQGTGTVSGDLSNGGTVQPGDDIPGTLSLVGNYTQSAAGIFAVGLYEFAVGQFDVGRLAVTGSDTLSGELAVSLLYGRVVAGDSFDIMSFLSNAGNFGSFSFDGSPCISGGADIWDCTGSSSLVFEEVFQPNDLLLVDLSGTAMVPPAPEPGSLTLLGSGLGILFVVVRRERAKAHGRSPVS